MSAASEKPETLEELLITLEKSANLRSLARECGLTPGDLKRRLKMWRRKLDDLETGSSSRSASKPKTKKDDDAVDLPAASDVKGDPRPAKGSRVLEIWTDGASRGNPGPASVGIVFAQKKGPELCGHGEVIGRATNNVAEYTAVLVALKIVNGWGVDRVHLNLDSELVARQLSGQYRVRSPDLIPLYRQIVALSRRLAEFEVRHVKREKNARADRLANLALDGKPLS